MGSYADAIMVGFVCRLCSEIKRCVIHFFGSKAKELGLLDKMDILPIRIEKYDNLPKTICIDCVEKLNQQYNLIKKIRWSMSIHREHERYHNSRNNVGCPLCTSSQPAEEDTEKDIVPGGSNG